MKCEPAKNNIAATPPLEEFNLQKCALTAVLKGLKIALLPSRVVQDVSLFCSSLLIRSHPEASIQEIGFRRI
jgi:hypothetical protein